MFKREYMDYHKDRFKDHSLLVYKDDNLIALFPACEKDEKLISHGGLTYGGFITDASMKQHTMNDCMGALVNYAIDMGFNEVYYKTIPHIFHQLPAEEDRYSLFLVNAELEKVEASSVINLKYPMRMPKGRKAQISRAVRDGVEIVECNEFEYFSRFIELENIVLSNRHATRAVHTAEELFLLKSYFPNNIHLIVALKDSQMIAGTVLYEYDSVVHTQYMAANDEARVIGALDLTIKTVIDNFKEYKTWLDFGISTENGGRLLNEGLIGQKESFGARTNIYETYRIKIKEML